MSSYAAVWQSRNGLPHSGRLELTHSGLWLHGGSRESEERVGIPYGEILGVERDANTHIGPCRAITVLSRNAGELLIASVGGVGVLTDIFAALHGTLSL